MYTWGKRVSYGVLVGKPEGKKQLGRLRHRWEYTVKVYQEIVWVGFD
jgi:hypothetical protein